MKGAEAQSPQYLKGSCRRAQVKARLKRERAISVLDTFAQCSEDYVEIEASMAIVVAEGLSVLWVGSVAVHVERVEVICCVGDADRRPNRVLLIHAEVFRNPQIDREVSREPVYRCRFAT